MRGILRDLTFTLVGVMLSYQSAQAAPIILVCTNPYQPNTVPFTIDLDQARSTVTINNPGNSNSYRAAFDPQKIKFNTPGPWAYTIDRVTATTTAAGEGGVIMSFPCHVGKAQL